MLVANPIVLALLLDPLAWLRLADLAASVRLSASLAAVRAAGDPVTAAELDARHKAIALKSNAAPFFAKAAAALEAGRDEKLEGALPLLTGKTGLPAEEELTPEVLGRLRGYLAQHKEALDLLRQVAAVGECRFELELRKGLQTELLHLASVPRAVRYLAAQAVCETEAGQPEAAGESLWACFRVAGTVRHDPGLISALVRIACDAIAVRQVRRWVERTSPSPEALRRVEEALRAEADPRILDWVAVGERCLYFDLFESYLKGDGAALAAKVDDPALNALTWMPDFVRKADAAFFVNYMHGYVLAVRQPYPQSLIQARRSFTERETRIRLPHILSGAVLPALGKATLECQLHMARMDSARVALAVLRYRAKNGRLPNGLDALVPEFTDAIPPDPFDGKPLRYRESPAGFAVYAVGEDGKDDGGDWREGQWPPPDIGFRMQRRKP